MTTGPEARLPGAALLPHGAARTFWFRRGGHDEQGFVLRVGDSLYAYANRCPHWNVDLDLGDERFYAPEIDRIYCKTHGALFLPTTGECDAGPCAGAHLEAFPVRVEGDDAIVTISALRLLA